jgi:hypothetical protein
MGTVFVLMLRAQRLTKASRGQQLGEINTCFERNVNAARDSRFYLHDLGNAVGRKTSAPSNIKNLSVNTV